MLTDRLFANRVCTVCAQTFADKLAGMVLELLEPDLSLADESSRLSEEVRVVQRA